MNADPVRGLPDPRPPRRIVDPEAGKAKVAAEGECRLCGHVPSGHPLDSLNRMHVIPKGQGGDDVEDNIIPGCGSGTTGCHGLLTSRREDPHHPRDFTVADALDAMNRRLSDRERAYAEGKKWPGWLGETYPRLTGERGGEDGESE